MERKHDITKCGDQIFFVNGFFAIIMTFVEIQESRRNGIGLGHQLSDQRSNQSGKISLPRIVEIEIEECHDYL